MLAPPATCWSFAWREGREVKTDLLSHREGAREVMGLLEQAVAGKLTLALQNGPYDFAVLLNEYPEAFPLVIDAHEAGAIHDTMCAEWLNDCAVGLLRMEFDEESGEYKSKKSYGLENLTRIHLGWPFYKDEWRMRYAELRDVAIKDYPEAAAIYPKKDAEGTLRVAERQRELAAGIRPHDPLVANLAHVCRTYMALHLVAVWGQEIDPDRVDQLNGCVDAWSSTFVPELKKSGLIVETLKGKNKGKLTKKKEPLLRLVVEDAIARGVIQKPFDPEWPMDDRVFAVLEKPTQYLPQDMLTKGGASGVRGVSASASVLEDCLDKRLAGMSSFKQAEKIRSSFGTRLARFVYGPMHSRYNFAETGRTTCSGGPKNNPTGLNIQQLIREMPEELVELMLEKIGEVVDVRSCIKARDGWVMSSTDYSSLEMCSFGQVLIYTVGWSSLADALNADVDPHLKLAAEQWIKKPYEEAQALLAAGDEFAADMRQLSKVPNFGLPGGLGGATMVRYAKQNYGGKFVRKFFGQSVEEQVRSGYRIKNDWFKTWPEAPDYFKIVGEQVGEGGATMVQFGSDRVHGGCGFTDTCNAYFQGLAADGATDALWRIVRECYDERLNTALFGSRVTGFVHDEYIAEHPEDRAHEAAERLGEIAVSTMQTWIPDVKIKAEPALMKRWWKKAKTVRDANGRLIPWEPKGKETL